VIARFEAERQALAMMNHPNIARVYDAGSTPDGRPFFAMEYVPGEPITAYCDRHRLSNRERLELFTQVCDAVQHAHQKAIIHRDLKPSNVLVMVGDGKPLPKIIDFGVAKATNQRLTEKTVYTELGQIIGTPEYMSPEQAEMGSLDIDTRTDIYSLGVLLYELLVGELPFSSGELRKAGYAEIQRIIREKDPPRPSTRLSGLGASSQSVAEKRHTDLVRLLRELRGDLDWIAMKALEKDRTRRYATASELAADVGRHLRDEPVVARPPGAGYRLKKLLRKHRGPVAAAGVVLLALLVGLAATSLMYLQVRSQREEKEAALEKESAALAEKTLALTEKDEALQQSEGLRLITHSSTVLPSNPGLALLLAIEGAKVYPGPETSMALQVALQDLHEVKTLIGHGGFVSSVRFSPDGLRVFAGSWIWDAETGKVLSVLGGDPVSFSADGRRVLTESHGTFTVWDTETGNEILVLGGQDLRINSASLSPDGRRVVLGLFDKTARIRDVETGKEVAVFEGHDDQVLDAGFSPDGRWVMTRSARRTVKIWEVETKKELTIPTGEDDQVCAASFSSDGRRLVAGYDSSTATIRDVETMEKLVSLRGHRAAINCASFSPDNRYVVTGSFDTTARVWDAGTGKEIGIFKGHVGLVLSATFSPDNQWVLTREFEDTARIWGVTTGIELDIFKGHEGPIFSADLSPDGRRVVTGSGDGTARIWDMEARGEFTVLEGHEEEINSASFSPDGKRVVTSSLDKTARIWDAETGKEVLVLQGHEYAVLSACFSPDGRRVVAGSGDKARIWDAGSGKEILILQGHEDEVLSASFSPDGRKVLTTCFRGPKIWDAETGKEILALEGVDLSETSHARFSSDGRRLITRVSGGGGFGIWDADTGKKILVERWGPDNPIDATLSPDGCSVLTIYEDKRAIIRDVKTNKGILSLRNVTSASFSPDGRRVVIGSESTAVIYDVETGQELQVLRGHGDTIHSVSFSPDGRRAMTCSGDGTARIWDVLTGKESLVLRGHEDKSFTASFSPDGRRVMTVNEKTVRIWPLDLLPVAESRKPRDLTPEEVERYRIGFSQESADKALEREIRTITILLDTALKRWNWEEESAPKEIWSLLSLGEARKSPKALELAREYAQKIREIPSRGLSSLWELVDFYRLAAKQPAQALLLMEEAMCYSDNPWGNYSYHNYRRDLLPDLVTYGSIDAALDSQEVWWIGKGETWKLFRGRSEPSPALEWTDLEFPDASWEEGAGGFGYELPDRSRDIRTKLEDMRNGFTTLYIRRRFEVADPGAWKRIALSVIVDDGFVAYLNGKEVSRANAGALGSRLPFDAVADHDVLGDTVRWGPMKPVEIEIEPALLRAGANCLALQGLNSLKASPDFYLIPTLVAEAAPGTPRAALDQALFDRFLAANRDRPAEAEARRRYFEGRILQRSGKHSEARVKFEEVLAADGTQPAPYLRLAECLRALGEPLPAEKRLLEALGKRQGRLREVLELWFAIEAADLGRSAEEILGLLPQEEKTKYRTHLADLRWALEELSRKGAIRINCGGQEHKDREGNMWGEDRFRRSGYADSEQDQPIEGTEEDGLYQTGVSFDPSGPPPHGYRIPLPRGRYRVGLGFAEIGFKEKGKRSFDVRLEGKPVLEAYEPKIDAAETRSFECPVEDGHLDIEFIPRIDSPQISALSVERLDR
jgi:WD40 repeat protein